MIGKEVNMRMFIWVNDVKCLLSIIVLGCNGLVSIILNVCCFFLLLIDFVVKEGVINVVRMYCFRKNRLINCFVFCEGLIRLRWVLVG